MTFPEFIEWLEKGIKESQGFAKEYSYSTPLGKYFDIRFDCLKTVLEKAKEVRVDAIHLLEDDVEVEP